MSEIITVTGNVATEPQQRSIGDDVTVTSFRVACTHRRFDAASRSWVDVYTNYYSVSAFRSLGRNAFTSLRMGDRVVVSGRLRLKEWDNGTRRGTNAEIDAESIGHDLLWGVTSYRRVGTASSAAPSSTVAPEPSSIATAERAPSTDSDGWAMPPTEPAAGVLAVEDTPF